MDTPKKKIPYISGNGNLKEAYILGKGTFQSTPRKYLIFQETETPQKFIFSQKKAVLIFQETETPKRFLVFQEMELSYISGSPKKLFKTKK